MLSVSLRLYIYLDRFYHKNIIFSIVLKIKMFFTVKLSKKSLLRPFLPNFFVAKCYNIADKSARRSKSMKKNSIFKIMGIAMLAIITASAATIAAFAFFDIAFKRDDF